MLPVGVLLIVCGQDRDINFLWDDSRTSVGTL